MTDESTLVRIADLARTLRAACPGDVANLRNARETLQWCREEPDQMPDRLKANARHSYTGSRALVDQDAGHLRELLTLVYGHLPAEGRTLRELSRVDEPLDRWDWNAASGELQGIEVAALAAMTPATRDDVFPVEANGNDLPSLEIVDVQILRLLSDGVARTQYDLAAINKDRKTLGPRLKYLRKIGYVKHPDGRKRGNVITLVGLERLDTLSESSP